MGTRSRIGIELKDSSILSVYCHYDGYPSFNGRVLRDHYTTREKVSELIDGGNISALHTNCGWKNETLPEVGPLYYTSRGESLERNKPRVDDSFIDFLDDCEEFAYIFTDAGWKCYNTRMMDGEVYGEKIPEGSVTDGIFKD